MAADILRVYAADIVKTEKADNGDLMVYGKATSPDLDLDGQRCDPNWLKSAMPAWFEWGNIREMHGPIAAGVGVELEEKGDDWFVKGRIVDPGTAAKIEAGVLKGYSIGIKGARTKVISGTEWITAGDIVELSAVDRPCNPTATMTMCKAATLDKGAPLQPVDDKGDLLEGIADWPVVDETGEDDDPALPERLTADERTKVADVLKTIGPDGNLDEQPDIEGGQQAITIIARLIGYEALELAAGRLDETCDIGLLIEAAQALKWWLCNERAAQAGEDGSADGMPDMGGITFVGLMAKYLSTADELDELAGNLPDIAKRDFSAAERRTAAADGSAMPDGSFPIQNKDHLKDAIRLAGHAKDPAAAKAHIKKRAKALGATDMIPDSWKSDGSKDAEPDTTKTTDADTASKGELAELVKTAVTEATEPLKEQVKAMSEDNATLKAELAKVQATAVPGGPVRRATTASSGTGEQVDKAARYRAIADATTDLNTKRAYQALADEEDAAVAK